MLFHDWYKDNPRKEGEGDRQYASRVWHQAQSQFDPSFSTTLSSYGVLVRSLRIVANVNIGDMAKYMGASNVTINSLEFGRDYISNHVVARTAAFFKQQGIDGTLAALLLAAKNSNERWLKK